jgi:hypothetical protein
MTRPELSQPGQEAWSPAGPYQIVRLTLLQVREMFELPQSDLFSEYRNFLTGVDFCLSELRGRGSRKPVRLEISLPADQVEAGVAARLSRTLARYCDHRVRYNRSESRSQRYGGISALRIGAPICTLGLALTIASSTAWPAPSIPEVLAEQFGWVLVWIGLWFPLDQFLFYPLSYGRETRVLRMLAAAEIVVVPFTPAGLTQSAG